MKRRSYRYHQLQFFSNSCECGRCGPCIERRCLFTLYIIQEKFSDQGKIISDLFTSLCKTLYIFPAGFHLFIFHVAKPSAKYRKPISEAHKFFVYFERTVVWFTNDSR